MISPLPSRSGFTLIEILTTMSLIVILAVVTLTSFEENLDQTRFDDTWKHMQELRKALVGDPRIRTHGVRSNFGYAGDVGDLPTTGQGLDALVTRPGTVSARTVSTSVLFSYGWNARYLQGSNDVTSNYIRDAWGAGYTYTHGGSQVTIVSYGSDGAAGGSGYASDITIAINDTEYKGQVDGFVSNNYLPYDLAFQVEMNYPDGSGGLRQTLYSISAGAGGQFTYTEIPFGSRSVTVYIPTKASPTTTIGPVRFTHFQEYTVVNENLLNF